MSLSIISTALHRLVYAFRIMFSAYLLGALVLGGILIVVTVNIENWNFARASYETVKLMFLTAMPLVTILLTANMFAEEWEERAFSVIWTYPIRKWVLLFERSFVVMMMISLYFLAAILAVHYFLMELPPQYIRQLIQYAIPTHVFLGGLTVVASMIGRSVIAGIVSGAGYWLFENVTKGQWTKTIFLFQPVWPISHIEDEVNRWWIMGLGCLFIVISFVLFMIGKRWFVR